MDWTYMARRHANPYHPADLPLEDWDTLAGRQAAARHQIASTADRTRGARTKTPEFLGFTAYDVNGFPALFAPWGA